jgi:uncharacterized protein (TIGR02300 family)
MEAIVAKANLGMKRVCPHCSARYYDLNRDPIMCPKCGGAYDPDAALKTRRTRAAPAVPEPVEPIAEEEVEAESPPEDAEAGDEEEGDATPSEGGEEGDEEEEEEVIEDASELGEDEDDMAEVIENVEDEEER